MNITYKYVLATRRGKKHIKKIHWDTGYELFGVSPWKFSENGLKLFKLTEFFTTIDERRQVVELTDKGYEWLLNIALQKAEEEGVDLKYQRPPVDVDNLALSPRPASLQPDLQQIQPSSHPRP